MGQPVCFLADTFAHPSSPASLTASGNEASETGMLAVLADD
jgi:hypothetical protein